MDAAARLNLRHVPWVTLGLALATLLVHALPALGSLLVFDREAIAQGEWWRLWTGNLVHFSATHLGYDLLALLVAGVIVERDGAACYAALLAVSALVIGLVVLATLPALRYFGGLSGVVVAVVVYLCLAGLRARGLWRAVCATVLGLVVLKLIVELATGEALLAGTLGDGIVAVPQSHVAGALCAAALFLLPWCRGVRSATRA